MIIQNKRLNTKPLIVHAQGTSHKTDKWLNIIKSNHLIDKTTLSNDITILTFASENIDFSLVKQLDNNGIDYINAAYSKGWKNTNKIDNILNIIDSISTPYILCLDAVDVLLSYDLSDLIDRFKSFDCDILYNASITNYPNICKDFEETESGFKYLNSGAFIGKIEYIKEFYQYIKSLGDFSEFSDSDQFKVRLARQKYNIKVDTECFIFQTLNGTKFVLFKDELFVM